MGGFIMDINKKVLNEVSKGAKMGMDAIKFVSDKVSDSRFQRVLNVEYLKYKEIFNRVGNIEKGANECLRYSKVSRI
jgi:hypothetical protein